MLRGVVAKWGMNEMSLHSTWLRYIMKEINSQQTISFPTQDENKLNTVTYSAFLMMLVHHSSQGQCSVPP